MPTYEREILTSLKGSQAMELILEGSLWIKAARTGLASSSPAFPSSRGYTLICSRCNNGKS